MPKIMEIPRRNKRNKIRCYVVLPLDNESIPLRTAIKSVAKEVGAKLTFRDEVQPTASRAESIYSEISRCDLVLAEISQSNINNIMYEIGLAHAMDKPVVLLSDNIKNIPRDLDFAFVFISYGMEREKQEEFKNRLKDLFLNLIKSPRQFRPFSPFFARFTSPPYIIDLDKMASREFENLCFELISQMGFRGVQWGTELKEIDAYATLPKKDPDGYEYRELWLISMGRRAPAEMILKMATRDPDILLHRLLRQSRDLEELFSKYKIGSNAPITILIILRSEEPQSEILETELKILEKRSKNPFLPLNIRVRLWDQTYLTNLIQQFPQIAFKYFSEDPRSKSKYRKTPEEMYKENVLLNERIQMTLMTLEEEKKKRFIAERNAAWKDVAFKAAHKLGNPIDAIDTFLQGLKRRLQSNRCDEAIGIANEMEKSIEESKTVIAQFKSLTKAQEINARPTNILPIILHSIKNAEEKEVHIAIDTIESCPEVIVDPDRMTECFNELVANSLHWFDKEHKEIKISIISTQTKDLPKILDRDNKYLEICFNDNGMGVSIENKEKIFAPFFTTYPHGTGLGLSMVKSIIEGHGGYIYENGKPNEGSSFHLFIPISKKSRRE